MSKPSHTCPNCKRSNFVHEIAEVKICKAKIKSQRLGLKRANFSLKTKMLVMEKQQGRCFMCHEYMIHADFHHVSDRCANNLENCVVLCSTCHDDVTFLKLDLKKMRD